jgi:3-oxoacyl-[acyl-carrier protein] reductase
MRFDGKVAVVTGASRGIGRATAVALAREGCTVVVNYNRNQEKARDVVEAIKAVKSRAIAVRCDVSVRREVDAMFKTTVDEFGKVDVLVNNAGIAVMAPYWRQPTRSGTGLLTRTSRAYSYAYRRPLGT